MKTKFYPNIENIFFNISDQDCRYVSCTRRESLLDFNTVFSWPKMQQNHRNHVVYLCSWRFFCRFGRYTAADKQRSILLSTNDAWFQVQSLQWPKYGHTCSKWLYFEIAQKKSSSLWSKFLSKQLKEDTQAQTKHFLSSAWVPFTTILTVTYRVRILLIKLQELCYWQTNETIKCSKLVIYDK